MGTISCIRIPQGQSTLHILAFTGQPTAGGITGAEFRIEVTNPAGYFFSYATPSGGFVVGNPLDLTPKDPNDPAGTTVLFTTCQPSTPPRMSGDRINLGTLSVYNSSGAPTDFIVTKKIPPDNPGMPYPRFFLCDAPFNTPVSMSMSEGADIAARSSMNSVRCEPRPGAPMRLTATLQPTEPQSVRLEWQRPIQGHPVAYNVYRELNFPSLQLVTPQPVTGTIFVDTPASSHCYRVAAIDSIGREGPVSNGACELAFGTETLHLDTRESPNDGAAGPVSSGQILDSRYQYLITVQGTFSLWPPSDWTAGTTVLCGMPEQAPQNASPNTVNGWVGADAEENFSVPLVAGGNCSDLPSLGYPPDHGRFMIDLGGGPAGVEPLGGTPDGFGPEHRYVYLVRGQDDYARFSLVDSVTSDNYGFLNVAIRFVDPTDAVTPVASRTRIAVLPNIPDPFNPSTTIRFLLPRATWVTVAILDVRGHVLRELFGGPRSMGYHSVLWDGRLANGTRASSGVYFARVSSPDGHASEKLILLK
jgi:hypothetical protein